MNLKSIITKLYYLLVHADGSVNEREIALGRQMIKVEGIAEYDFNAALDLLKKRNQVVIYDECMEELKRLDHEKQVRCVAWLCVVANADGFMDKTEWQFIYKIYQKELSISLDEIMKVQKELIGLVREKSAAFSAVL